MTGWCDGKANLSETIPAGTGNNFLVVTGEASLRVPATGGETISEGEGPEGRRGIENKTKHLLALIH